jgi:hypothetical protein
VRPRRFTHPTPSKTDKTRAVDIRITDMPAGDAAWWDARIRSRADRFGGAWSVLFTSLPLGATHEAPLLSPAGRLGAC